MDFTVLMTIPMVNVVLIMILQQMLLCQMMELGKKGGTLLSTPETDFCVLSESCSSYAYWENKKDAESSIV